VLAVEVSLMVNPDDNEKVDVYLQDVETKTMTLFATISGIEVERNYPLEFVNDNLYYIKRTEKVMNCLFYHLL